MIVQVAIFGVSDTGEVVDDVLMARHDPIASSETVALDTHLCAAADQRLGAHG
ncbi:MAG: hypothetical protein HZT43_09870 [Exiguobacterium profundum]|nr:MAG: hypothetical protein HZT43_09870 [Exiguobacterium profundum]